jgi:hypothetical protein
VPENAIIDDEQNQISYNVVLDPSDIARQAEEIRNQLDLALGVGSNAGTQFINTTDFINPQFAPLPQLGTPGIEGQFGGTFDQNFWKQAQEQVAGVYQNLSAGLDRVRQDISMISSRTTTAMQGFQPTPTPYNPYQELLPDTFGEQILSQLGFGGDPSGPIAPSVYQKYGQARLGESIRDILQNPGETYNELTSTPLGMAANIAGYFIAPGAMLATDLAMLGDEFLSGAYNKREDLAGGIGEIARQQFGGITKESARGIAQNVIDYVGSYEGYARGYDLDEVSQNILQFGNMGGFANVRNPEQLQEKITSVVEDTRQIARNLGVFQEEAINIMAELEQKSMVSAESMRDMSERMRFYGGVLKQAPTELLSETAGMMETFRQGPMERETVAQSYIDARVEAQRLIQSTDPYVQESLYRLGGPAGATQSLMGLYGKNQGGAFGNLMTMGQFFGGTGIGGDLGAGINAIGQGMQDYGDYMNFVSRGAEDVYGEKTLDETILDQVGLGMFFWENIMGQGTKINPRQLEGILMTQGGLSRDEARVVSSQFGNMVSDPTNQFGANLKAGRIQSLTRGDLENRETGFWDMLGAGILRPIDEVSRDASNWWGGLKNDVINEIGDLFGTRADIETGRIERGIFNIRGREYDIDISDLNNPVYLNYLQQGQASDFNKRVETRLRRDLKNQGKSDAEIEETISLAGGDYTYDTNLQFLKNQYSLGDLDIPFSEQRSISSQLQNLDPSMLVDDSGKRLDESTMIRNLLDEGAIKFSDPNLTRAQQEQAVFQGARTIGEFGITPKSKVMKDLEKIDKSYQLAREQKEGVIKAIGTESQANARGYKNIVMNDGRFKNLENTNPPLYKAVSDALNEMVNMSPDDYDEIPRGDRGLQEHLNNLVEKNYNEIIESRSEGLFGKFTAELYGNDPAPDPVLYGQEQVNVVANIMSGREGTLFFQNISSGMISEQEDLRREIEKKVITQSSMGRTMYERRSDFLRNFRSGVLGGISTINDPMAVQKSLTDPEFIGRVQEIERQFELGDSQEYQARIEDLGAKYHMTSESIERFKEFGIENMPDGSGDMQKMPANINSMAINIGKIADQYLNQGTVNTNGSTTAVDLSPWWVENSMNFLLPKKVIPNPN